MNVRTHRTRWTRFRDFVSNYFYYRRLGHSIPISWEKAGHTI